MKCTECGGKQTTDSKAVRRYGIGGLPHVELHGVEVTHCESCGMEEVTIPRIAQLHSVLANHFIQQTRALAPAEIRFLRKHVGLSATDFAKYMGAARETVSRWETGKQAMGQSADRLLRLLVVTKVPEQDYALVDVLKEITEERAPKRLPRFGMRASSNGWRPQELMVV